MRDLMMRLMAIPAEVGARKLVYGASAGAETHGRLLLNSQPMKMGGLVGGAEGAELEGKVWEELKEKLEAIRAGSTAF